MNINQYLHTHYPATELKKMSFREMVEKWLLTLLCKLVSK